MLRLTRVATVAIVASAAIVLVGCGDGGGFAADRAPTPSFELIFPPVTGDLMTTSSPNLIDLSGDRVPDIVFGTGVDRLVPVEGRRVLREEPKISGYVVAVSGASNEVLWRVPNPRDAFTTPRFVEVSGDGVPDVIMGGREGLLSAFSGVDGAPLWRLTGVQVAETPFPYNFFTPAVIRDADDDEVPDLVVLYGGDDTKPPNSPRDPGYIVVVSGADGAVLAVHQTPDGRETYSSAVVYERPGGAEWLVFGTGGETHGGAAYRAPVASLLHGTFAARVERLIEPGEKGVMAPATLVDLTGDGELDIVISTFDGRLIAVAGATGEKLWERRGPGEEAYHPPAVVRLGPDGRLGLFISRGIGEFPEYRGSVHRLLDAADGRVLLEYENTLWPGGAPLAVDLTGDGVDEPIFFSARFPATIGARIHVLHLPSDHLITYDLPTNFGTTPVVADVRGTGTLEMIGLAWTVNDEDAPPPERPASTRDTVDRQDRTSAMTTWRDMMWQLLRLDLSAEAPPFRSWAAYMGTATDGVYRPPGRRCRMQPAGRTAYPSGERGVAWPGSCPERPGGSDRPRP